MSASRRRYPPGRRAGLALVLALANAGCTVTALVGENPRPDAVAALDAAVASEASVALDARTVPDAPATPDVPAIPDLPGELDAPAVVDAPARDAVDPRRDVPAVPTAETGAVDSSAGVDDAEPTPTDRPELRACTDDRDCDRLVTPSRCDLDASVCVAR